MKQPDVSEKGAETRVLLVDDNHINRKVVTLMMGKLGICPDTASNGQEAVQKVTSNVYDLVLMDLHMPGMGGMDATKKIRETLGEAAPPIVALTADAIKGMDEQVKANGMVGYITKPVSSETLKEYLEKYQ